MAAVKLILTDLDNTLYDWLGFYIPSFLAMVEKIHRISGVDVATLKRSFRKVHQAHQTTEYAFAIEELDILAAVDPELSPEDRLRKYDDAVHAFRSTRKRTLHLYPGVRETLERLREIGIPVVAHSDSMMSYVSRRLRQLGIDGLLSAVCAPRDHGVPASLRLSLVRQAPLEEVESRMVHLEFPPQIRKPDVNTVTPVLQHFGVAPSETLYVGDSLSRDMLLARRAGMTDVWAKYGRHGGDDPLHKELLDITYWTQDEIEEEERLRREVDGLVLSHEIGSFDEILLLSTSGVAA